MAYNSGYGFESFYGGAPSSLSPEYGDFIGGDVRIGAGGLGFPGSPQTANQLGETVNALKQGVKTFEVSMLGVQDADQTIPKQHFQEMKALMRLSGVKPSVHGPLIDAAGFGGQDGSWAGETGREDNERKMFLAIERAKELDQTGNLPIVFHSSVGAPGNEYTPDGKPGDKNRFKVQKGLAINQETGRIAALERTRKFDLGIPDSMKEKDFWEKGREHTPQSYLRSNNRNEWENKLTDMSTFLKHSEEVMSLAPGTFDENYRDAVVDNNGKVWKINSEGKKGEALPDLDLKQAASYNQLRKADIFLENVELNLNSAFHNAYKYAPSENREEVRKALRKFSDNYAKQMASIPQADLGENGKTNHVNGIFAPIVKQRIIENAITELQEITKNNSPEVYRDAETFAKEKAAETFGNLAIKSYAQWQDKAPVLAIENLYQGMAFSKADDLKDLVDKSRKNFVNFVTDDDKMGEIGKRAISEKQAKKLAEKKIGVTWDVGHLNMIKKKGFNDKDVVSETEKIKDYVKHVHLTDNFGFGDSHLAPGMGNVPFKEILKELEKTGRLGEMSKIVEAGGFVQHFKKSPHPWTLSALGSPIYGAKMGPYWNQVSGVQGGYFGGYGMTNPSQHHSMYGAGFTTMPLELGGQMPGGGSRFDGRPMA